ncbi:MAG: hypothetical protein K6T66_06275 [Peptococcaceae bacterium]|nr:hypothetical protein [Peptococcaceae bacterium]
MAKGANKQASLESEVYVVANRITAIIEKYTDQIELLDIIDIVDNLRVLVEMAESAQSQGRSANVA